MTLQLGEVVLPRMQFHETAGVKNRPAAVLLDTGDDDFIAAPVTSQSRQTAFDVPIREWREAGLNVESFVRVRKFTDFSKVEVLRHLGELSEFDRGVVAQSLCQAFCPNPKA